ncbi:hypothetical protein EVAR_39506_1 [Eumeta japonica]|uniref:Uncharacterized protein n=1 Tax=Eumeta variegata TaxID=151549 RepID=A0A4C1W349_EUMVA|nr:hypothetical protein EVAR_39506_1 [Eumeta japonica]
MQCSTRLRHKSGPTRMYHSLRRIATAALIKQSSASGCAFRSPAARRGALGLRDAAATKRRPSEAMHSPSLC